MENAAVISAARLQQREDQVFLVLALVIGALTGLAVVAFILLTERAGMRLYPVGGAPVATRAVPGRRARWASATCCTAIFPTRAAAECRKPRRRCLPAEAASRCAPWWESSFALRQRWPAESRWGARGLRFKLARALLPCSDAAWDCVPKK